MIGYYLLGVYSQTPRAVDILILLVFSQSLGDFASVSEAQSQTVICCPAFRGYTSLKPSVHRHQF